MLSVLGDLAVRVCATEGCVTADDLHRAEFVGDRRVFGFVLRRLVQTGVFRPAGYVHSKRAACHYRPIVVYKFRRVVQDGGTV